MSAGTDARLDDLLALERRGWDSLCDGTGADFYAALMTDDAVMVLAGGLVLDRDGVAASLSEAPPWSSYDLDQVRLVECSDGAVLVYRGTASRKGEPPFVAMMASHYVRVAGEWRLATYQQTPAAG